MTPSDIIFQEASKGRVPPEVLSGPRRNAGCVRPRHSAMYRCRRELGMSYPAIGRVFHRDHTTVMHAVEKIKRMAKEISE